MVITPPLLPDILTTPVKPADMDRTLSGVPVTDDVIEYTLACALALSPPDIRAYLREHIMRTAGAQSRKVFGGDRVYIGKRTSDASSTRNDNIKRDYWQRGERIALLERRYGLGKTRLWEIIKS